MCTSASDQISILMSSFFPYELIGHSEQSLHTNYLCSILSRPVFRSVIFFLFVESFHDFTFQIFKSVNTLFNCYFNNQIITSKHISQNNSTSDKKKTLS